MSLDTGVSYDSNKYNYNSSWVDTGVRVSWNIMKLAQYLRSSAHKAQNETDDLRRMALSMAVLTQVRLGVQRYDLALSELRFRRRKAWA